jgi:hypothetical protein
VDNDQRFTSEVVAEEGEARVVLHGEIDVTAVPEFFARVQEGDRANADKVVLRSLPRAASRPNCDHSSQHARETRLVPSSSTTAGSPAT